MEEENIVRYLAGKIEAAYKTHGFAGIIIYGVQGAGKSTLALRVAKALGYTWREVLQDVLVFTLEDLKARLDAAVATGKRWKVLVWDDAGVHGSAYIFHLDVAAAAWLSSVIQLARTQAAGLILTTPSVTRVAKAIRDQPDWLRVELRPLKRENGDLVSRVRVYGVRQDALGKQHVYTVVEDALFTARLPWHVRAQYVAIRRSYATRVPDLAWQRRRRREDDEEEWAEPHMWYGKKA
ncbi:MAG: hypothetical protein QXT28_09955 [Thermofilaceae archaeon]